MLEDVLKKYGAVEMSAMDVYKNVFKLGEGYLQCSDELSGEYKANPLIYYKNDNEKSGHYRILFEDKFEEVLKEGQAADFCISNGLSYFGRKNLQDHASKMFAMIFDVDGLTDVKLNNLLYGCFAPFFDRPTIYPLPNYVVLSGHNCHFYYVFEEPISLYPNIKLQLKNLKYGLTALLWNRNTSSIEKPQFQGINQGFRPIGAKTKVEGFKVKAFQLNTHPYNINQLNEYVPDENKVDDAKLWKESKYSLEKAKELFPKWYDKVILNKDYSVKKWDIAGKVHGSDPFALYHWWLNLITENASFGHRYFCILTLTIYAVKNDVPFETLKKDAYSLIPIFNSINPAEAFTKIDVDSALECYDDRYCTFPIKDISKLSAIPIQKNKRNFRKQNVHLKIARATLDIMNEDIGKNLQGRHDKQEIVREWRQLHPEGKKIDCHKDTGISRVTIDKWWDNK